jgi:KaiC/GvpD/RAD55 family RecA-like ATPase
LKKNMQDTPLLATKIRGLNGKFGRPRPPTAPESQYVRLATELAQAVRARDEFIAIAAHELRNPMTPILGYAEYLLAVGRRPESECPEAIIVALKHLVGLIGEYIKRATTLLDVSRITGGKLCAELSLVELSGVMRQAVERHRPEAERSDCRLWASIEDNVSGLLDQLAVEQIADNLLSNAIKYGAGEPIEVSLVRHGARAQLTVRDHGIGIYDVLFGTQAERELEVHKLRGTDALRGRHSFRITDAGIVVYPRVEALLARPSANDQWSDERCAVGVHQLDAMIGGGIPRGTTTLVLGASGSGKTSLSLHFLSQSSAEEGNQSSPREDRPDHRLPIDHGSARGPGDHHTRPSKGCSFSPV